MPCGHAFILVRYASSIGGAFLLVRGWEGGLRISRHLASVAVCSFLLKLQGLVYFGEFYDPLYESTTHTLAQTTQGHF